MSETLPAKTCTRCGEQKSRDDFHAHPTSRDGRDPRCKACAAAYYMANRERILARKAARRRNGPRGPQVRKPLTDEQREKRRVQAAQWRAENPEAAKAVAAKYRAANREKIREYGARYYSENRALKQEQFRRWAAANPERALSITQGRRARKRAAKTYYISPRDLRRLRSRPCIACGSTDKLSIDHLIPLSRGGSHGIGNVATLCQPCNSSKRELTWFEWKHSGRPRSLIAFRTDT